MTRKMKVDVVKDQDGNILGEYLHPITVPEFINIGGYSVETEIQLRKLTDIDYFQFSQKDQEVKR